MRRGIILLVGVSLAASACSSGATRPAAMSTPPEAPPKTAAVTATASATSGPAAVTGGDLLAVQRSAREGLVLIDAASGTTVAGVTAALTGTGGRLFATTTSGSRTTVTELTASSAQPRSIVIDGDWRFPTIGLDPTPVGASADGSTLVLVEASPGPDGSRFGILSTSLTPPLRVVSLAGRYDFDAVSLSAADLYVVEHLAQGAPGAYQVRAVELFTGALIDGVIADKRNLDEQMAGTPIAQVRTTTGLVFTLYLGAEHPFIHTLFTSDRQAVCIDLPAIGGTDATAASDWGLGMAPGGAVLYAVNATSGLVVDIDPLTQAVRRVAMLGGAATTATLAKGGARTDGTARPAGRLVAVLAEGTKLVAAGATGLSVVDTAGLKLLRRVPVDGTIDAVVRGTSPETVYVLLHEGGRIQQIDVARGVVVGEVAGRGYVSLVEAMPGR